MQVFVAHFLHDRASYISVHRTREGAERELATYARENWEDEDLEPKSCDGLSDEQIVAIFFAELGAPTEIREQEVCD